MVVTPPLVMSLFQNLLWKVNTEKKEIFLTFDDGPTPEVTNWVLEQLEKYDAKATFFCIGSNVEQYPDIFSNILSNGHSIGNHTHNHFNGWKTDVSSYISNVEKAQESLDNFASKRVSPKWFRPPYGKIRPTQAKALLNLGYKIVMWHVVAYDWDSTIPSEKCLTNIVDNTKEGSIVVLHDSLKANKTLRKILPTALEHFSHKGYKFKGLMPS